MLADSLKTVTAPLSKPTEVSTDGERSKVSLTLSKPKPAEHNLPAKNVFGVPAAAPQKRKELEAATTNSAKREKLEKQADPPVTWLRPGLVVKVVTKKLDPKLFKQKGRVTAIKAPAVAVLSMLESGQTVSVDEGDLETVLPSLGGSVLFVKGRREGLRGVLEQVEVERFVAKVRVGETLVEADYDHICKLAAS